MKRKNAKYSIEKIVVRLVCHFCNSRLDSPSKNLYWDRDDVANQMNEEMTCPNCWADNQLPQKLINTVAGF